MRRTVYFLSLILFLLCSSYSVTYIDPSDVFRVDNVEIEYHEDNSYTVHIEIENFASESLELNVETSTKKEGLIIDEQIERCRTSCTVKISPQNVFIDTHEISIVTRYNGKIYREVLQYEINLENTLKYSLNSTKKIFISGLNQNVSFSGNINSQEASIFDFEIYPNSQVEAKKFFSIECSQGNCPFNFFLLPPLYLDNYTVKIFSRLGESQTNFEIIYREVKKSNTESNKINKTVTEILSSASIKEISSNSVIYNSKLENIETPIKIINKSKNNILEIIPKSSSVKKISIPTDSLEDISIGFEHVVKDKVNVSNTDKFKRKNIINAFAIDPHLPENITNMSFTFIASGFAVYKCTEYDFTAQNCYGEYNFLMNTIPGAEYTVTITPEDPLFVEINQYRMSPTSGECRSNAEDYASTNCDDSSFSGSRLCPSGASGEFVFCDDTSIETQTANGIFQTAGVRVYFSDTTTFEGEFCQNIETVEVIHKTWRTSGTQTISIDADGNGWTEVATITSTLEPGSETILDVTNSLPGGETWDCSDFFGGSGTAGIQTENPRGFGFGGSTMSVDTLTYRITFNYTIYPLELNKLEYIQGEEVFVNGTDLWQTSQTITFDLSYPNGSIVSLPNQTTNGSGSFNFTFFLDDYTEIGSYTLYAEQPSDTRRNHSQDFNVTLRIPRVFVIENFTSRDESIKFYGKYWAKDTLINIESFLPNSSVTNQFPQSIYSNSTGGFNFEINTSKKYTDLTGPYKFNLSEDFNNSYNDIKTIIYGFRPNSTSGSITQINTSNNIFESIGGAAGVEFIDIFFPQTLVPHEVLIDSFQIGIQYTTQGNANRELQWYNESTGLYQTACLIPDSATKSIYLCDLTIEAGDVVNKYFNKMRIRLEEDGGVSEDWNVDFIYVLRNFTHLKRNNDIRIKKDIERIGDDIFSIFIQIWNPRRAAMHENTSVMIYDFLPNTFQKITSNSYQTSDFYSLFEESENLDDPTYNGTITQFTLSETNELNVTFYVNEEELNENNSWYVRYNVSGINNYSYKDLFIQGFDPIVE